MNGDLLDPDFPDGYTEYEIAGVVFRVGPPELTYKNEGDQMICRVESTMKTIYPQDTKDQKGGS